MQINEYQEKALETANFPEDLKIIYPALGLNGEAGEVAEKIKKVLRDNNREFSDDIRLEIAKELGDCLWYVSTLAHSIGYKLEEIAQININKLSSREQRNMISGSGDNR